MKSEAAPAAGPEVRRDYIALALITSLISVVALWFYCRSGAILLYGDAPAHINIARRVFDSRTPGLFQLGTVWLPLPHLLQIPLVANRWLWQTGLGASIPSILAYIAGSLGIFRLVRGMASRTMARIAALIFAANPNLIYMQSTAMTEALYLALFIWTVVFLSEFIRETRSDAAQARRSIEKCGIALACAMLVRYDAWFLAAVLSATVLIFVFRTRRFAGAVHRGVVNFLLLTFLTPCLWLAYNHAHYGNALEFANGQYSPAAIQERSRTASMLTYPGESSPGVAALYFLKLSRLNTGEGLGEYLLMTAAFISLVSLFYFARRFWPWVLLWTPVAFYTISIAWGSVPVYLPEWWPFSHYNLRYGLQMLPAIAVFTALGYELLGNLVPRQMVARLVAVVVIASYSSVWLRAPVCLREAHANGAARLRFDEELARQLKQLPASSTILMDCSAHPGAVELAGVPFRRVLRESNPPFWEIALTRPARSADYIVAIDNDDVWRAVRLFPQDLQPVARVGTAPGLRAVVYQSMH